MKGKPTKYKTARKMSGLTQEAAAEQLFISVSNLKRIESGQQKCSLDIAEAIDKLYGAPWVSDPTVPEDYVPLTKIEATLQFIKERNDVNRIMERATEILADGRVDESEAEDFRKITIEIREERDAARNLLYAQ